MPNDEAYYTFVPQNIDIDSNGTILVSSTNSIIKVNADGTDVKYYAFIPDLPIKSINVIKPSSYLINTKNKIYKIDSSFVSLTNSIEFPSDINKLIIKNDTVYSLFNSSLVRLDTSLNIIDTLLTSTVNFQDIEVYNNDLWVQLNQSDSVRLIHLHDFENPHTLTFPIMLASTKFIVLDDNRYVFLGKSFSDQVGMYYTQTENTEISSLPDIELLDISIDSIMYSPPMLGHYSFIPTITVKNNGDQPISSFGVFSFLNEGMNCVSNYYYYKKQNGTEVLPGQTQTFTLGRMHNAYSPNLLCLSCLSPNSNLEIVTNNNFLCKALTITGVTNGTKPEIKVYPNPVTDYLIIEDNDTYFKNIEIADINGRVLISKLVSGQRAKIETTNLIPGLYIAKISLDTRISNYLIMKE